MGCGIYNIIFSSWTVQFYIVCEGDVSILQKEVGDMKHMTHSLTPALGAGLR